MLECKNWGTGMHWAPQQEIFGLCEPTSYFEEKQQQAERQLTLSTSAESPHVPLENSLTVF